MWALGFIFGFQKLTLQCPRKSVSRRVWTLLLRVFSNDRESLQEHFTEVEYRSQSISRRSKITSRVILNVTREYFSTIKKHLGSISRQSIFTLRVFPDGQEILWDYFSTIQKAPRLFLVCRETVWAYFSAIDIHSESMSRRSWITRRLSFIDRETLREFSSMIG